MHFKSALVAFGCACLAAAASARFLQAEPQYSEPHEAMPWYEVVFVSILLLFGVAYGGGKAPVERPIDVGRIGEPSYGGRSGSPPYEVPLENSPSNSHGFIDSNLIVNPPKSDFSDTTTFQLPDTSNGAADQEDATTDQFSVDHHDTIASTTLMNTQTAFRKTLTENMPFLSDDMLTAIEEHMREMRTADDGDGAANRYYAQIQNAKALQESVALKQAGIFLTLEQAQFIVDAMSKIHDETLQEKIHNRLRDESKIQVKLPENDEQPSGTTAEGNDKEPNDDKNVANFVPTVVPTTRPTPSVSVIPTTGPTTTSSAPTARPTATVAPSARPTATDAPTTTPTLNLGVADTAPPPDYFWLVLLIMLVFFLVCALMMWHKPIIDGSCGLCPNSWNYIIQTSIWCGVPSRFFTPPEQEYREIP